MRIANPRSLKHGNNSLNRVNQKRRKPPHSKALRAGLDAGSRSLYFSPVSRRFLPFWILLLLGAAAAFVLVPAEARLVADHLAGFPAADAEAHRLRPVLLGVTCFLPALFGLFYGFCGLIDRYLLRHLLGVFLIFLGGFFLIWVLLDVNDNLQDFGAAESLPAFLAQYYLVNVPPLFVLVAPYALLFSLIYSLGLLSKRSEIVAMIQTGRGVARLILPLGVFGVFVSVACLLFNYHWAPWADGYRRAMVEELGRGTASQATNVVFHHAESGRFWHVQHFPYDHSRGAPLGMVRVTEKEDNVPVAILRAREARWDPATGRWAFSGCVRTDLAARPVPLHEKSATLSRDWPETPWQILKPGLSPQNLGIPGLNSWLKGQEGRDWVDRSPHLTQWHSRWAQPWICLVIVLLAAPLGIVFSRRGATGGVLLSLFLAVGMFFLSSIFLAVGESGNLSPALAAWATNLLFLAIALVLLYRRASGRPLYETFRHLLPVRE